MIKNLKSIQSRNDFFQVRPFDIHKFSLEFFGHEDHPQNYQDHISKINDVLFPLNDLFAVRVLTNINTPYHIQSSSDFSIIEGSCSVETKEYTEKLTEFNWLQEIHSISLDKRTFNAGEKVELEAIHNRFFIIKPETKCVLGHWNYQAKNETNIIGKFKFDFLKLSDQSRKLIKLSKNIYSNEGRRSEEYLKEEFYKILNMISEKDLFFIYITKSFLVSKAQSSDFFSFFENKFGWLSE